MHTRFSWIILPEIILKQRTFRKCINYSGYTVLDKVFHSPMGATVDEGIIQQWRNIVVNNHNQYNPIRVPVPHISKWYLQPDISTPTTCHIVTRYVSNIFTTHIQVHEPTAKPKLTLAATQVHSTAENNSAGLFLLHSTGSGSTPSREAVLAGRTEPTGGILWRRRLGWGPLWVSSVHASKLCHRVLN